METRKPIEVSPMFARRLHVDAGPVRIFMMMAEHDEGVNEEEWCD
jgi:hypothetical protein